MDSQLGFFFLSVEGQTRAQKLRKVIKSLKLEEDASSPSSSSSSVIV